jgi:hypothetical protein
MILQQAQSAPMEEIQARLSQSQNIIVPGSGPCRNCKRKSKVWLPYDETQEYVAIRSVSLVIKVKAGDDGKPK